MAVMYLSFCDVNIDKTYRRGETSPMVSLLVHAVLGLSVIAWIIASNSKVFARPADGPLFSPLEAVYYIVGIASVALGWYFNITYVNEYSDRSNNTPCREHGSSAYD